MLSLILECQCGIYDIKCMCKSCEKLNLESTLNVKLFDISQAGKIYRCTIHVFFLKEF